MVCALVTRGACQTRGHVGTRLTPMAGSTLRLAANIHLDSTNEITVYALGVLIEFIHFNCEIPQRPAVWQVQIVAWHSETHAHSESHLHSSLENLGQAIVVQRSKESRY